MFKHRTMLFSRCVKGTDGGEKMKEVAPLFMFHIYLSSIISYNYKLLYESVCSIYLDKSVLD